MPSRGMERARLCRRLSNTATTLSCWNCEHFGFTHTHIKALEDELKDLQETKIINSPRQIAILEELKVQRGRLESIAKQKSRELWL